MHSTPSGVKISGIPILAGEPLSPVASVWSQLHTHSDYLRFASSLRGQFAITAETAAGSIAITDSGGSRPIFYRWDDALAAYRITPHLAELTHNLKAANREALYFYATRGGIGVEPFYDAVKGVFPATVTLFQGPRVDSESYLDWGQFLEEQPIGDQPAEDRFIAIASNYLKAVLQGESKVGCLLSGGVDSALVAWLLQSMGKDVVCLTADYEWKRYSEFASAAEHANALKLHHERVVVQRRNHREAFRAVNSERQNAPCCHSQSPSLFELARRARELGINKLVTGDHADALFLGFDRFFRAFPQASQAYAEHIAAFDASQKIGYVYGKPSISEDQSELLTFLGHSATGCAAWQQRLYAGDCSQMSPWAERASLPVLQQLAGQIWAGVSWQNIFLPVTQAFNGGVEFISPFYDLEMIKFALALPLRFKFHDGVTKVLLRNLLQRVLRRSIVKRASPNPSRVWSLIPNWNDRRLQSPRLRPLYDRVYFRNMAHSGKLANTLDKISALGIWASRQLIQL